MSLFVTILNLLLNFFLSSASLSDAVGVYVKYVVPGSAADHSGNIRVHDRIIAVRNLFFEATCP